MDAATVQQFVSWFRNSSPYINAHKGKTFVLAFDGALVTSEYCSGIVHDLALLSSLGVRLVLVHGATTPADAVGAGATARERVTNGEVLALAIESAGSLRARIEALLSMGIANSPMHGARIRVCSGNFVTAQPLGVRDGIDYQHTGTIRRMDRDGMAAQLAQGNIVLLSPLGYSPTGEIFRLSREEVAVAAAVSLAADKLIFLEEGLLTDSSGQTVRELPLRQAQDLLSGTPGAVLGAAVSACQQGIDRCHVLDYRVDGALLQELFSRDGVGSMINGNDYEAIRQAGIEDVVGIMGLIGPLERDGTLVRRSRERLELEIGCFSVVERDGAIIACAALYPDQSGHYAELACVATDAAYRRHGRANRLLEHIETRARQNGIQQLFVLTTHTAHWFVERGFRSAELAELPAARRELYNYQRNSQVYIKPLA